MIGTKEKRSDILKEKSKGILQKKMAFIELCNCDLRKKETENKDKNYFMKERKLY